MSTIDAGRRERRRLLRQVLIPVVLLILVGMACNLLMTVRAGAELDRDTARTERQMVAAVTKRLMERMHQFVADYSYWDEFYLHARAGIPEKWSEENLGPYMQSAFQISETWVIGDDGKVDYGWSADRDADGLYVANPSLRRLIGAARTQPERVGSSPVSSYVVLNGVAYIAAAAVIEPVEAALKADPGRPHKVFLAISPLSDELYRQVAEDFSLAGLAFVVLPPDEDAPHIDLSDLDGQVIGHFVWQAPDHALGFIDRYWPTAIVVLVILLSILAVLTMRWMRMIETMQLASRTATVATRESRAKSVFIANMSHELRTPLNAIIGFSELMASETFGPHNEPRYKEYSGDILTSGRHLLATINDVLSVAKIEAGQYRFDVEDCSLDEAAHDIVRLMGDEAERRGIALAVDQGPDLAVKADAKALRQVLSNIVSNGLKFTKSGGAVTIGWAMRPDAWRVDIVVTDTGIGIPPDKLESLGTAFYQVSDLLTRNEGGMGLGLSIVNGMMTQMNGSIAIASETGVGTRVTLTLPRSLAERASRVA